MSESERPWPSFDNPPLVEVALSVQFDPVPGFHAAHLGLLWSRFRDRFPSTEEYPPLPETVERFGIRAPPHRAIELKLADVPPVPRVWFLNEPGTQLIQLQQDRLAYNWRKGDGADPYPHYGPIRDAFAEALQIFQRFVAEEFGGEFIAKQCEVTYVDHILPDAGWQRHGELAEVVTLWAGRMAGAFLPEPEQVRFSAQYVIPGAVGREPLGRLHIDVEPGYRVVDERPIVVMSTTARGRPDEKEPDGVLAFLDIGHEWIVRSFVSITSPKMQKVWGRNDGF